MDYQKILNTLNGLEDGTITENDVVDGNDNLIGWLIEQFKCVLEEVIEDQDEEEK